MSVEGLARARALEGDYRGLIERSALPMALVAMRDGPRLAVASRGFLDVFGLRRAAVIGRSLAEVLGLEGGADLATAIGHCLATGRSHRADVDVSVPGDPRIVEMTVYPANADVFAGHVIIAPHLPPPAVNQVHREHTASLEFAREASSSMNFVHHIKTGRLRYAGGLGGRLGFSGGRLTIPGLEARLHGDDTLYHEGYLTARAAMTDDHVLTRAVRVKDRDGQWRLVNFRSSVLRRNCDGTPRLMGGTATDITELAAAVVDAAGVSVFRVEERERARIARELHDSTAQYLVAADLGLAKVLSSGRLSADKRARLKGVQASLATAQAEMRTFSFVLHPPELRDLGLAMALQQFCTGFARRSGLQISFVASNIPVVLPADTEHALFRVAQEAVMNVYRHAFAHGVSVALQFTDGNLMLKVRDDGIGVDGMDQLQQSGVGIAGMRSRIREVGGDLGFDYSGPGLALLASVPIAVPAPPER